MMHHWAHYSDILVKFSLYDCSWRVPRLQSTQPKGGSQPSVTPVAEDIMPLVTSLGSANMCSRDIHSGKTPTPTHIKWKWREFLIDLDIINFLTHSCTILMCRSMCYAFSGNILALDDVYTRLSICIPGCPGTHHVDCAGLKISKCLCIPHVGITSVNHHPCSTLLGNFILLFLFCQWDRISLDSQTILNFTMLTRLTLNSQRATCLYLPSSGI